MFAQQLSMSFVSEQRTSHFTRPQVKPMGRVQTRGMFCDECG